MSDRADELLRWADTYGEPEEWAKRAQAAHARAERAEERIAELEAELAIPVPRRGHYADMEVCAAILKTDPRERASGYDANPRQMGEVLQAIVDEFSPASRMTKENR